MISWRPFGRRNMLKANDTSCAITNDMLFAVFLKRIERNTGHPSF
jgi:hypothetical protein